jgi:hypothetical protein
MIDINIKEVLDEPIMAFWGRTTLKVTAGVAAFFAMRSSKSYALRGVIVVSCQTTSIRRAPASSLQAAAAGLGAASPRSFLTAEGAVLVTGSPEKLKESVRELPGLLTFIN